MTRKKIVKVTERYIGKYKMKKLGEKNINLKKRISK